jgi:glycosyltransferase involved in cell wall biosynthesis
LTILQQKDRAVVTPRFSLIVPTLGRTTELKTLLTSIHEQQREDVEVILVDQNEDNRVSSLLDTLPFRLNLNRIRSHEKNPSAARNLGMDAASGTILAFPDDDCWYPSGLLDQIDAWFDWHSEYAVLAVGALDDEGVPSGNRWIQDSCDINSCNALRTTFCSSLFIAAAECSRRVRFDPKLSRAEETDFVLRLLATGLRGRFDRTLHIHHPRRDMLSGTVSKARAMSYGHGMGRLVRRHSLYVLWAALLAYDLGRAVAVSLRGRLHDAGFCFAHACGLFTGFVFESTHE